MIVAYLFSHDSNTIGREKFAACNFVVKCQTCCFRKSATLTTTSRFSADYMHNMLMEINCQYNSISKSPSPISIGADRAIVANRSIHRVGLFVDWWDERWNDCLEIPWQRVHNKWIYGGFWQQEQLELIFPLKIDGLEKHKASWCRLLFNLPWPSIITLYSLLLRAPKISSRVLHLGRTYVLSGLIKHAPIL